MPYRPASPCLHPGCPELSHEPRCPKHQAERDRQQEERIQALEAQRLPSSKRGYTATWRRLRISHLREHPLCVYCEKEGRIVEATVVDHMVPHKGNLERFYDPENLQSLCKPHHDEKTAKDGRWGGRG